MKKQLIIIGIILILLTVGLSGCNSNTAEKNKFIGTWQSSGFQYTFQEDGSYLASGVVGTWSIKDNGIVELNIGTANQYTTIVYDYVFSNDNTTLTLTLQGGTTSMEFTKQ